MVKHKSTRVSLVPTLKPVRLSKKVTPMYDQQHYQENTNRRITNKQKKSFKYPSLVTDSIELSSSNNQFRETSRAAEWNRGENNPSIFTTSERFSQLQSTNTKNADENRKRRCLKPWLIFAGVSLAVITLVAMILSIYLLIITNTTTTSTPSTTITCSGVQITQPGDPIFGVYNTTAGQSTGGFNGRYSGPSEEPPMAIDGLLTTKYLNFGNNGSGSANILQPGINTGFYVTPNISKGSVACGLLFGTATDSPQRDPITVALEGTNSTALNSTSNWALIYSGPTGIDPVNVPNRSTYGTLQVFSNIIAYQSYRLLITSQRAGYSNAVQYGEAQIMGYY